MRILIFLLPIVFLFTSCDELPLFGAGSDSNEAMKLNIKSDEIRNMQHIKADFLFVNLSGKKVEYGFPSSCQHGFIVKKSEEIFFDSRYAYACLTVLTSLELRQGESKTYKINLSGAEYQPLDSGTYTLDAFLLTNDSDTVSTTFTVD
ncbi:MAG: BsuPI-related putative proteinase inhibitor [Balneolaceae bacterium]